MARHEVTGAVVTGGGSGLGRALALELHSRGAAVVIADLDLEGAEQTVAAVRERGGRAWAVACDVRDPEAVAAVLDAALGHLDAVDMWINNAGVAVAGEVGDVALDDWHWVVDVNLWGMVHGCHVIAPYFKQRGAGVIVNVASAAGLVSTPGMAPYNVSKAGVVSLSETLYGELSPLGVGVTVVCPTFFQTRLLDNARSDAHRLKVASKLMKRSSVQADGVARAAIDDALAHRLYSVAMRDGRMVWRLRRLLPQGFYDLYFRGMAQVQKRV
ncbi:MAG: SDR family NAD(P)-dependent oxidoreductase [Alphaproteobacteria bacterium]|nr:SDR family NAD(P)-dependent oxidoreductase [Alphaproteobacteria bacterium]